MKKPVLTLESDGKWTKIILFDKDISPYVDEAIINLKPGEVTASLKLSRLDTVTSSDN